MIGRSSGLEWRAWSTNTSLCTSASWPRTVGPVAAESAAHPAGATAAGPLAGRTILAVFAPPGDASLLHDEIVMTLERYRPDAVITFDEDGLYWHLDHIGVHERTVTAVTALRDGAPPLYLVTMPNGAMREVVEAAHAKGGAPPDS